MSFILMMGTVSFLLTSSFASEIDPDVVIEEAGDEDDQIITEEEDVFFDGEEIDGEDFEDEELEGEEVIETPEAADEFISIDGADDIIVYGETAYSGFAAPVFAAGVTGGFTLGDTIVFGSVPDFSDYKAGGDACVPVDANPGTNTVTGYNDAAAGLPIEWQIVDVVDGDKVVLLATDVICNIWNVTNFSQGRFEDSFWLDSNMIHFLNGGEFRFWFDNYWVGGGAYDGYTLDHKSGIAGKAFTADEQASMLMYDYAGADGLDGSHVKVAVPSVAEIEKWSKIENVNMIANLIGSNDPCRWYTRTPSESDPRNLMNVVNIVGFVSESGYNGLQIYQTNLGVRPVIILPIDYFEGGVHMGYVAGDTIVFGSVPDFSDYKAGGDACIPVDANPGTNTVTGYNDAAAGLPIEWQIVDVVDGDKVVLLATEVICNIWNVTNFSQGRFADSFWLDSNMIHFLNGGEFKFWFDNYWVGGGAYDGYTLDHKGGIAGKAFTADEQALMLAYGYADADGLDGSQVKVAVPSVAEVEKWSKIENVNMIANLIGSNDPCRWYTRTPSESDPRNLMNVVNIVGFVSESGYNGLQIYQTNLGVRPIIILPLDYFEGGVTIGDSGGGTGPGEALVELGFAQEYSWDGLATDGSGKMMKDDPRIVIFDDFSDYNGVASTHIKGSNDQTPKRWFGSSAISLDSNEQFSGDYCMKIPVFTQASSFGNSIGMWVDSRALRGEPMNDEPMTGMPDYRVNDPNGIPLSSGVNPKEGGFEELYGRVMVKYAANLNLDISCHNGLRFEGGLSNRPGAGGSGGSYTQNYIFEKFGYYIPDHPGSSAGYRSNGFDRVDIGLEPEYSELNVYYYGPEQVGTTGNHMFATGEVRPSTGGDALRPVNRTNGVNGFVARPNYRVRKGEWNSMEYYVKLNTVVTNGTSPGPNVPGDQVNLGPQPMPADGEVLADGILRVWMDGVLVLEYTDVVYRHTDTMILDVFKISTYFANYLGEPSAIYYDNVVVATEYIGPVNTEDIPDEPEKPAGFAADYLWDGAAADGSGALMKDDPRIVIMDNFSDYTTGALGEHIKGGSDKEPKRWIAGGTGLLLDRDESYTGNYSLKIAAPIGGSGGAIGQWVDTKALRGEPMNDEPYIGLGHNVVDIPEGGMPVYDVNHKENGYEELYARYMVKYGAGYDLYGHSGIQISGGLANRPDPNRGGGLESPGGSAGYRSNGYDRFTVRLEPEYSGRVSGVPRPGSQHCYFYGAEQLGVTGNHMFPNGLVYGSTGGDNNTSLSRTDGVNGFNSLPPYPMPTGEWVCMEFYVKLNTVIDPGTSAPPNQWPQPQRTSDIIVGPQEQPDDCVILRDGVLRAWANGELILDYNDVVFRYTDQLYIDRVAFATYFGNNTSKETGIWYDNIVIATERVGAINMPGSDPDWRDPSTLPDPPEPDQPILVSPKRATVERGDEQQFTASLHPGESLYIKTGLDPQMNMDISLNCAKIEEPYNWSLIGLSSEMLFNGCHGHTMEMGMFREGMAITVYYDSPYDLAYTKEYLRLMAFNPFTIPNTYTSGRVKSEYIVPVSEWDVNNKFFTISYENMKTFFDTIDFNDPAYAAESVNYRSGNFAKSSIGRMEFAVLLFNEDGYESVGDMPITVLDMRLHDVPPPPPSIRWSVNSAKSSITQDGLLTVAEDEPLDELLVTVLIPTNLKELGTAKVKVIDKVEKPEGFAANYLWDGFAADGSGQKMKDDPRIIIMDNFSDYENGRLKDHAKGGGDITPRRWIGKGFTSLTSNESYTGNYSVQIDAPPGTTGGGISQWIDSRALRGERMNDEPYTASGKNVAGIPDGGIPTYDVNHKEGGYEEVYFRAMVKYSEGWELYAHNGIHIEGGNTCRPNPGRGGGPSNPGSSAGYRSNGYDILVLGLEPEYTSKIPGVGRPGALNVYYYGPEQLGANGNHMFGNGLVYGSTGNDNNHSLSRTDGVNGFVSHEPERVPVGEWYCMEYHIKLNTVIDPGTSPKPNQWPQAPLNGDNGPQPQPDDCIIERDGVLEAWVNGVKVMEYNDVVFRYTDTVILDFLDITTYIHGNTTPNTYHVWYDNIVLATERVGMVNLQGADPDWRDPSTLPDPTEPVEELQPVIVSGLATEVARGASQQFSACYLPEEDQSASSLSRSLYVTTNLPEQRDYKLTINTALTDNDDYPWNDLTSEMLFNGCHGHNMDMGQYWNSSEKVLRVYYDSPYDLARTKEYLKFFGFNPFRYGDIYDTNLRPEFVIPITKWDENNGWFELSYAEVLAHVGKANLNAGSSPLNDAYNLTGPNLGRYQFAISIYNPDGDFTIGDLPVLPKDMRLEYAAIAPEPIVWFVEGNYSANTTISNTGLLTVGADETAEELTVKAALMSDFTVFGTFELTVVDAPEVPVDKSALESLLYDEDDGAFAFADAACAMYPGVVPASAEYAMFLGAIADAEMVFNSDDATQDDIDAAYDALYEALAAFEAWVGGIVIEVKLTNVSNAKYVSIIETSKNSRVWELTFTVTLSYSDGSSKQAKYTISLNGNNANLDGKYVFGAGHDLGGYTLVYDIKGNGSNIKDFRIIR